MIAKCFDPPATLCRHIPGYGRITTKFNAAFSYGEYRELTPKDAWASRLTGPDISNHYINVDFQGFDGRRSTRSGHCGSADVDRHYSNDNSGGEQGTRRSTSRPATSSFVARCA